MSARPRVTIDARMIMDGGIGTYLQQLLPRVFRKRPGWQFILLGNRRRLADLGFEGMPNVQLAHAGAPIFSVREQLEMPRRIPRDTDLYWAPNYDIPVLARVPLVVTIHDVNHVALPELLGGVVRRRYARWMMGQAIARARRIIFDSDFTRHETTRFFGDAASKGTVVHLGVDSGWWEARERSPSRPEPKPYFLYVGNIKRHKNVPFLLRAFGAVMKQVPHRLLLIGRTEGLRADPQVMAELERLGERAALLGELDNDDVRTYVAHAEAVVTASLYEGFGLPALEAMATGIPCLVSRAGSLPEICGDAALLADPRDESAFAASMLRIANDARLRQQLVQRGKTRAAQFTWDVTAEKTAAVLSEAL